MRLIVFLAFSLFLTPLSADSSTPLSGNLRIVTSFPTSMTSVFQQRFKQEYPDIHISFEKKKTGAGIEYLESLKEQNTVDLFWASSPDAFELLKAKELLSSFEPKMQGVPGSAAGIPLKDNENQYHGFALSGFGFMANDFYLDAKSLSLPKSWKDLTKGEYYGHLGISSPSRSGTTHIMIEGILQSEGWEKGWALIQQLSGNMRTITKKSSGVPKKVKNGEIGIGAVIDYYALTAKANQFPISFTYPKHSLFLPASIAIVKDAPNQDAAEAFVNFLLSEKGQVLLLNTDIRRIPIRTDTFRSAPSDYPNPYSKPGLKNEVAYDIELSKQRYHLVNSIFDNLVTFNFESLKQATGKIIQIEQALAEKPNSTVRSLLHEARSELKISLVSVEKSMDESFREKFTKKRKKKDDPLPAEQKNIEDQWNATISKRYAKANELLAKAQTLLEKSQSLQVSAFKAALP